MKRRIRRNGLSEEMNSIDAEKRQRDTEKKAELKRLRDQLAKKDEEIERLRDSTIMSQDTDRILQLEQELESLRTALSEKAKSEIDESDNEEWTLAAQDPFSDDYMDDEGFGDNSTDGFGDSSMADLACSTPSRAKVVMAGFPTPPSTSPAIPTTPFCFQQKTLVTPSSHIGVQTATPSSHIGVQVSNPSTHVAVQAANPSSHVGVQAATSSTHASVQATTSSTHAAVQASTQSSHISVQAALPDPEKQALETKLNSVRQDLTKLTETLESHESLKARLSTKLHAALTSSSPSSSSSPTENQEGDIESHLNSVLQSLSDRTAALQDLNGSLCALGFPGKDGGDVVSALGTAFRAARLELEYLAPGELTLPLSSHSAEVLDLVLERLRGLARKSREDDETIDEYHALEQSLRQQLGTRVEATDRLNAELARAGTALRERDDRAAETEVGLARLKGALADYGRDVAELEALVQRLEADGQATECALQVEVDAARGETAAVRADLEDQLEEAHAQIQVLAEQLPALHRAHGRALAKRDARAAELRAEADQAAAALRLAQDTIRDLRVENASLAGRADDGKARAREVVDALRMELERVVRMSTEMLASTATPRKEYNNGGDEAAAAAAAVVASSLLSASRAMNGAVMTTGLEEPERSYLQQPAKQMRRRKYDSGLGFLDEIEDGDDIGEVDFV